MVAWRGIKLWTFRLIPPSGPVDLFFMPRLAGSLRLFAPRRVVRRPGPRWAARRRARAAVLTTLPALVAIIALSTVLVERYRFEAIDIEYAQRRALLAERQAERPGEPLVLVAGSSRVVLGFAPELLPPIPDADGRPALPFNFAHYGAGPIMTRFTLGRALADGVWPRAVVLELMPAFFARENARFVSSVCTARDAARGLAYYPNAELGWEYVRTRSVGLPGLLNRAMIEPDPPYWLNPLGGYASLKDSVPADERAVLLTEQARHFGRLLRDWKPDPGAERAFRDTVALCRARGARVAVILTPEGHDHRKLYGPGRREAFHNYAIGLAAELGLPLTDCRDWLEEADFSDSHHPLRRGAAKFTARFGAEVIPPLLRE